MNLYLIRHAISTRKSQGVWGRTFDAPLAKEHLSDLSNSRDAISRLAAPTFFSSPLLRCRQSLDYVMEGKWPICVIPEFRAYHSGRFETVTDAFIKENFPQYLELSYAEKFNDPKFGEESIAEQATRVRRGLLKMFGLPTTEDTVICSHYSVIKIICNLVARNFNVATYGKGDLEISEGGIIRLSVDTVCLITDLQQHE